VARERLLTVLTAAVAAVGLSAGPAAAQLSVPGVGDVDLGGSDDGDCLEVGVDIELGDLVGLDPSVCVLDEDGSLIDLDGGVEVGDEEVDVGGATAPVTDAVDETSEKAEETVGGAAERTRDREPEPAPQEPAPEPPSDDGNADQENRGAAAGSTSTGGEQPSPPRSAETAEAAPAITPAQERRIAALRGVREDLAAAGPHGLSVGGVMPAISAHPGGAGSFAAPEVADGELSAGVGDPVTPEVADPQRQDALLATSTPARALPGVPLPLQLLAGALVLGTAGVWFKARREFGGPVATDV
jgi:hypothetical protein